ncbi:hypothetical protein MCOR07_005148 [Pyricularia oryzae]|uniref:Antifreeze protein n=1 Tax=Pyricularia grisea TaxID=148305 RepID=A0ABQ8P0E4_PYRGI|nr:hypothetical protein MCOR33_000878 [Pyricularia grisea]KAI6322059.1 hypothetical protein MCOR29_004849 [Pyricularia oryzae]KAI6531514.1 hypothetical protein MCOR05_007360 [Pyricularia oryzae]KAI6621013.1 hypothetical protein MCOR07_005148 [Pyricularia oryzae]
MQLPSALVALVLTIAVPLTSATPTLLSRGELSPAGPSTSYVIGKTSREATADIKARSAPLAAQTPVVDDGAVPGVIAARSPGSQTAGRLQGRGMGKIARRGRVVVPPSMEDMP